MSCGASKTTVGDRTFWKEICRNCNFIHTTPWQSVISSPLPMIFFTSLANWHSRPARIISIHLIPHYDSIRITPNFNAVFINHLLGIPRDFHRPLRIRLTKPGIFYRGRWTSTNISMLNKKTFNMSHPTIGKPYINPYFFRYQPKFFHISTHMFHIYISIYIYISPYVSHGTETIHVWCHFPHSRGPSGLEFRTRSRLDVALGERGAAPRDHTRNAERGGGCVDMVTWEMIGKMRQHYGNE
jgi:hypothetical protein